MTLDAANQIERIMREHRISLVALGGDGTRVTEVGGNLLADAVIAAHQGEALIIDMAGVMYGGPDKERAEGCEICGGSGSLAAFAPQPDGSLEQIDDGLCPSCDGTGTSRK